MEQYSSSGLTMDPYAEVFVLSLLDSQVSSQESQHAICLFDCLIYMAVLGET